MHNRWLGVIAPNWRLLGRKVRRSALRTRIEDRAEGRCEYCRAPQDACGYHFHLEHVVPVTLGGADGDSNRALACASCNLAKSDRISAVDPDTGVETPLFHPRNQIWNDHFRWSSDGQTVIGDTASGRVTIICLDLNSELRMAAHKLWFMVGLLP